jgi:acyl-coenzyme A synthetase/AMP-(fatty) acid ligase
MKMLCGDRKSLRDRLVHNADRAVQYLHATRSSFLLNDLLEGSSLSVRRSELYGLSVLVATHDQLTSALTVIELDGCARRITILPPDVETDQIGAVMVAADIDAVVIDRDSSRCASIDLAARVVCTPSIVSKEQVVHVPLRTEWVLLTSGTVGVPKMILHDLGSLAAAVAVASPADGAAVWGTFYDIRRYGGLQIFLRALLGSASLVLSNAGEPVADHLARLAKHGATHISGTPSHWRRAMMRSELRAITPRYVRLSGEIADQAILDGLRVEFPHAAIGHAYASTEAGVAFDVNDGLAGFPAAFIGENRDDVEMKVLDGSLHIRSPRTGSRYLGTGQAALTDADGFVDTGDRVERRGDRYYFVGRRDGIINVGGLKIHAEEIEAVINRHPQVQMSLVRPKHSPVTGSIVVAEVVLKSEPDCVGAQQIEVRNDILKLCHEALPRHKIPAAIRFVSTLPVTATGKLARRQA